MKYSMCIIAFLMIVCSCSSSHDRTTSREKMLLRYILRNNFKTDQSRFLERHKDISEFSRSLSFEDALTDLPQLDDPVKRKAIILFLGLRAWRAQSAARVRDCLSKELKAEPDKWTRLEMARVLASIGDDSGKDVLIEAIQDRGTYFSSNVSIEFYKATIPLLLLEYDFPEGLPRWGTYAWGGLAEFLSEISK